MGVLLGKENGEENLRSHKCMKKISHFSFPHISLLAVAQRRYFKRKTFFSAFNQIMTNKNIRNYGWL